MALITASALLLSFAAPFVRVFIGNFCQLAFCVDRNLAAACLSRFRVSMAMVLIPFVTFQSE